jgi:hypothetical protein
MRQRLSISFVGGLHRFLYGRGGRISASGAAPGRMKPLDAAKTPPHKTGKFG